VTSLRGVARALTARGVPSARGTPWSPVAVKQHHQALDGGHAMKVLAELPENAKRDVIGGGLFAWIVDDAVAHWNIDVPGQWQRLHTLKQVGSYVSSFVRPRNYRGLGVNLDTGIYRLIGFVRSGSRAGRKRPCRSHATQ
jgi:hypothetical protein